LIRLVVIHTTYASSAIATSSLGMYRA
jgi:hypothetical protein